MATPRSRLVATHGDFYSKQVLLIPDGRVTILDLDEAASGEPETDVGNFLAHLRWSAEAARLKPDLAVEVERQFLCALERTAPGTLDRGRITIHIAAGLFKLCARPFRDRCADWPVQIDRLLAATAAAMNEAPT